MTASMAKTSFLPSAASQLDSQADSQEGSQAASQADSLIRYFEICNKRGLHARASARFVKLVSSFKATVEVNKDGMTVGGTSIMGLMLLAASPGCKIAVHATGKEAKDVLDALEALIADRFGEEC